MMFQSEDFTLPMETSLRLRVMADEIDACTNVETLQEQLKNTVKLTMLYQHMLNQVVERQLTGDVKKFEDAWKKFTEGKSS